MSDTKAWDLLLKDGQVYHEQKLQSLDVAIKSGTIVKIGKDLSADDAVETRSYQGKWILPGVIDSQVHFREPGLEHKEDLESGSAAAALGGITTFLEMPNTSPPTTDRAALEDKVRRGTEKSYVNFGFFMGASKHNVDELKACLDIHGCCGVKIFLGSSTGSLLLYDEEVLSQIFREVQAPIAVHSENETLLRERVGIRDQASSAHAHAEWRDAETALSSTKWICELARKTGKKLHILHISTHEEMSFLKGYKDVCTVEVTPQHLTLWAPDCYDRLGPYAQMNPPVRSKEHLEGLWRGVDDGTADVIGSDHAPHTREEKDQGYPKSPSGMPGVQTLLPLMLQHMHEGKLSLDRLVDMVCTRPAQIYGLKGKGKIALGYDADITVIDPDKKVTLTADMMASRCGWTPFAGSEIHGFPIETIVHGQSVMRDGVLAEPLVANAKQRPGKPIRALPSLA